MGVFQKNSFFLSKKKIEKKNRPTGGSVVPQGGLHGGCSPPGGDCGGESPRGGLQGGCRARKKKFPKKSQIFFLALIDL